MAAVEPIPFQKLLLERADLAIGFLVRAIEACGGQGAATYYSRFYCPRRGWFWPYPETTGYIIPTLLEYAAFANRPELAELAVRQADWILSLQYENGALPGGHVAHGQKRPPSIFNTGQMILGLVAAADHTGDQKYLESASRAAHWLAGEADEKEGTWTSHGFSSEKRPSYYTRVCWPMLEVFARTGETPIRAAALRVLGTIRSWQLPGGGFPGWMFEAGKAGYTHTVAYVLRGFLESARILGNDGESFERAAYKCAEELRRRMELRGKLAGAYHSDLQGVYWYTCLTGNCQIAIIWMLIYQRTGDARFLSAALKALQFVIDKQRVRPLDQNLRGAIAGSSPIWGRYLTLRYPNWAAKFFVDACLMAHRLLGNLLEHGPCISPSPAATAPACTPSH